MADNTVINAQAGGDSIRDKDRAGVKTQIVGLDLGIGGAESLMNGSMPITAASLPLPTGASTEATLSAQSAKLPASLGQKAMVASMAVVVANDQSAVPVSGTVTATTPLLAAAALADAAAANPTTTTVGSIPLLKNASTVDVQRAVLHAQDTAGTGIAAAGVLGEFDDASTAAVTENQFAPVRISSRRAQLTEGTGPTTATTAGTQVASSASSVTLLSSNALRRGLLLMNNSTSLAYVLFGTTASTTAHSLQMAPNSTYEMFGPNLYSGRIDAIWATANGNMQVTEW